MLKLVNIICCLLIFEQCSLAATFLLSSEKELIVVPSVAFRVHSNEIETKINNNSSNDWILYVQGWFFEENYIRAKLVKATLSTMVDDINKKRISYFTASAKKYKTVCINGLTYELCTKTDANGLIKKQFQLPEKDIERLRVSGGTYGKLEYVLSTSDKKIQSKGEIFLCDDDGISIISDIDDTIKITGVTNVRSILKNTFSGEYKSVPGMSERYRHYESKYNATFHYLTASPDQLYPFLRIFLQHEQFPLGSYHMRHFTWFDMNFIRFFSSASFIKEKTKILEMFFQETHSRKFVLFGDIFQKDPEIYASIYQKYPERILKIFIRVSSKNLGTRLNTVFENIPKNKWNTFHNGFDLPETFL